MRLIDKQFPDTPFYGVRQMTWHLKNKGHKLNKKRIRRLMQLMGLMPIYQKPDTSKPDKACKSYLSYPGRKYGRFLNIAGLSLCHFFIACKGVLLPRADCGSFWL